jgi:hypothetical protein
MLSSEIISKCKITSTKPISLAISIWVSNSKAEPKLICKNLEKSFYEVLEQPSAIFDGMETAHLLI